MTQEFQAFDSLKSVFDGVTFEGSMKRLAFLTMDKQTIAETLPQPLERVYGAGKTKIATTETPVRMVYGYGSAKTFDPDSLSLMLHLKNEADAKATAKTLADYFAKAGIKFVSIEAQQEGRGLDVQVKLPLTAEAFESGQKLAKALVQKFS